MRSSFSDQMSHVSYVFWRKDVIENPIKRTGFESKLKSKPQKRVFFDETDALMLFDKKEDAELFCDYFVKPFISDRKIRCCNFTINVSRGTIDYHYKF